MDSVPLEMDDIFGEHGGDDDDGGFNLSALPDLEDELEPMRDMGQDEDDQEGEDGEVSAEVLAKLKSMKGASKNTTKRSMPKLDATRLTGDRGIPIIPKSFEKVRLKGKNHEAEDLKVMMHTLQHWGHRLFPKMTFDEVLERVERLGAKKEVQTCLKKIRLDMPVLESDMVADDEEEDTVQRAGATADHNLGEEDNHSDHNNSHNEISDDELEHLLRDQGQPVTSQVISTSSQKETGDKNSCLSDDIKRRIEENKRKAMEKRAAKMAGANKTSDVTTNKESLEGGEIFVEAGKDSANRTSNTETTSDERVTSNECLDKNSSQTGVSEDMEGSNEECLDKHSPKKDVNQDSEKGTGPFVLDGKTKGVEAEEESMELGDVYRLEKKDNDISNGESTKLVEPDGGVLESEQALVNDEDKQEVPESKPEAVESGGEGKSS